MRANPATSLLPLRILASSREEQDLLSGYRLGTDSLIFRPVDCDQFADAVRKPGLHWLVINESPPQSRDLP